MSGVLQALQMLAFLIQNYKSCHNDNGTQIFPPTTLVLKLALNVLILIFAYFSFEFSVTFLRLF